MTQEQFNNTIIKLAKKVYLIREYSYQRRGAKFDPRRPNLMLSSYEMDRVVALEEELQATINQRIERSKECR